MCSRLRRTAKTAALVIGGGFLMAGPGTGCLEFVAESGLETLDFCFIFDCQNGLLGGTIDPCPVTSDFSGEAVFTPPVGPFFRDCPNAFQGP